MSADLNIILPEILLSLFAMGALLGAVYTGKDKLALPILWATAGLFVAMAFWIGVSGDTDRMAFGGMFTDDAFSRFAKVTDLAERCGRFVAGSRLHDPQRHAQIRVPCVGHTRGCRHDDHGVRW